MKIKLRNNNNPSGFLRVKCKECRNEQIIYNKASMIVECLVCNNILAEPTGGRAIIKGVVLKWLG